MQPSLLPVMAGAGPAQRSHQPGSRPVAVARWFSLGLSAVYLVAFASLWSQVPGLFGREGLLPVGSGGYYRTPWLLLRHWFRDEPAVGMEAVCMAGTVLSAMGVACARFRCGSVLAVLWWLYRTVYRVGGDFLGFQWDILLLECGLLGVLSQPLLPLPVVADASTTTSDAAASASARASMGLWVLQWLFFRLMFASGAVKLLWGDADWWSLTALASHFQSTCIPTPLSAVAHRLPLAVLKASTALTYVIEMPAAFLCILPTFNLPAAITAKRTGFLLQFLFQIAIQLTGNYGFFNMLTATLCLPMLSELGRQRRHHSTTAAAAATAATTAIRAQDKDVGATKQPLATDDDGDTPSTTASTPPPLLRRFRAVCPSPATAAAVLAATLLTALCGFGPGLQRPRFSALQFQRFTRTAALLSVAVAIVGGLQPLWACVRAICAEAINTSGGSSDSSGGGGSSGSGGGGSTAAAAGIYRLLRRSASIAHTAAVAVCSGLLFGASLPVFFEGLNLSLSRSGLALPMIFQRVSRSLRLNDALASYGLFRSMTGE
jgi:hypothetical protein